MLEIKIKDLIHQIFLNNINNYSNNKYEIFLMYIYRVTKKNIIFFYYFIFILEYFYKNKTIIIYIKKLFL